MPDMKNIRNDPNPEPRTSSQSQVNEDIKKLIEPKTNFCCQANPIHYRSKGIQASCLKNVSTKNMATSPIKSVVNVIPKTNGAVLRLKHFDSDNSIEKKRVESSSNSDIWKPHQGSSNSSEKEDSVLILQSKQLQFRVMIIEIMETNLHM